MDIKGIIVSEINHIEKDKYGFTYMWNLKKKRNKLETKLIVSFYLRTDLLLQEGRKGIGLSERGEGIKITNW